MSYESAEHHPAFEEYSETIFELEEDGIDVIQARIAERLGVSRPAVSEMIKRMGKEGLVEVDDDSQIGLTRKGRSIAQTVVRRHRIAERFLTDVLQLGWAEAHHEAGKWEHVISGPVEEAMMRLMDDPTTCPHGNPIPGTDYVNPEVTALGRLAAEDEFTVARIPEELEFQEGQLTYLENAGLIPGRQGRILSIAPDGTATVSVDGNPVGISSFAADRILVLQPAIATK